VAGVIVGARNARHVADHQRMFSLSLDEEDLAKKEKDITF
jgi:aryl-alcohol dehydrogenase-like predicted oxidoreductase